MNKLLFALATATIGLVASQAFAADAVKPIAVPRIVSPAPAPVTGYLDVYGGWGWSKYTTDSDSFGIFGGNGAMNAWLSPTTSLQLDLNAQATTDLKNCCGPDGEVYGSIGGHWSWRDQAHLFGVFAAASATNELDDEGSNTQGLIGVEGQIYLGNVTWYGQAGYLAAFQGSNDYSANVGFGRLVGRLFLTPNSKFSGEVGYAAGQFTSAGTVGPANFLNWGLAWEQQLAVNPLSVFVSYTGYKAGGDPSYGSTQNQVVAGLKVNFGGGTLMDQDRHGAALDLPNTLLAAQTWDYQNY
jgi:hypothetical protein